jgi:membrane protein YqaA with SNARE-associated domain
VRTVCCACATGVSLSDTTLDPCGAELLRSAALERDPPHTRVWFAFFIAWMAGWAGLALWAFGRAALGDDFALRLWLLALTCFYLSLCNTLVPLPTAWIVLLAGSPEYGIVHSAWLRVVLVAALTGAATAVSNLNEYHLASFILRHGLGRRIRGTRVYGWATRWFDRSPFQILLLVAFIPIPVDVLRWLAILRRYSRVRFGLAYFVGRGARYLLFAACSTVLALGPRSIVLIQVALVLAALFWRLGVHVARSASVKHQQGQQRRDERGDRGQADELSRA